MSFEDPTLLLNAVYWIELPQLWIAIPTNEQGIKTGGVELNLIRLPELGSDHPGNDARVTCEAYFKPTPEAVKVYRHLATIDVNEEVQKPGLKRLPNHKDVRGPEWIPELFWRETESQLESLDRRAGEIVNKLCWRFGVHDGPSVMRSSLPRLRYSYDGGSVSRFPLVGFYEWDPTLEPGFCPEGEEFEKILKWVAETGATAPLHHTVFQEADRRRWSEPRVAIVMAVVAAESAVKKLVADLFPDTRWLLENIPSPPVTKIVKELFPKLPAKCRINGLVQQPTKKMRTALHDAVELRNAIVHGREAAVADRTVDELLSQIKDLLALIDYYAGNEWAFRMISKANRAALEAGDS